MTVFWLVLVAALVLRCLWLEVERQDLQDQLRGALRNVNTLLHRHKIVQPLSRN